MFTKTLMIALASVSLAATALPAYASSSDRNGDGSQQIELFGQTQASVLATLKGNGINASSVDQWGSQIRAGVVSANGATQLQFFHPYTFQAAD